MAAMESDRRDRIAADIDRHGWHCVFVSADEPGQEPFACTIGLAQRYAAPELLVFGLPDDTAHALLQRCVDRLAGGGQLVAGDDAELLGNGLPVRLRALPASQFDEYLGTAQAYHDDRVFDALVLLWPDRSGRLPGDPGYDAPGQHEALAAVSDP